jgi:hypothetical protein
MERRPGKTWCGREWTEEDLLTFSLEGRFPRDICDRCKEKSGYVAE